MPLVGAVLQAHTQSAEALARAQSLESLEGVYAAWAELKAAQREALHQLSLQRARLTDEGQLLLGAVRTVRDEQRAPSGRRVTEDALAKPVTEGLEAFVAEANAKLAKARAALEAEASQVEAIFQHALEAMVEQVIAKVKRRATVAPPTLRLMIRTLSADQRIIHAERLSHDDAVAAFFAFSGRIPSRYDSLFDDSTDDARLAPPTLLAEEGLGPTELRPTPAQLVSLLGPRPRVWPLKGCLLVLQAGMTPWRWLQRGPVMEAELADGDAFRGVLSVAEAEQVIARLVALKLQGRLDFELTRP